MNFNYKSKTGFTLIELLVVIGILAVLAAIAIPSVAGLIDRANISADKTNATEMTNAVERFTSEYELYKQDLSTGTLDTTNLDASSSRVYNVTGITSRADIEKFESDGIEGKGINIDTKYPANEDTIKAVIKNYMKTTSSTFEPKQSDMAYYYSPEAGVVAVVKEGSTITEITDIALTNESTFKVANTIGDGTTTYQWINISMNESLETPTAVNVATGDKKVYTTLKSKVVSMTVPSTPGGAGLNPDDGTTPKVGDKYTTEDYEYEVVSIYIEDEKTNMWNVKVKDEKKLQTSFEPILESINGMDVGIMYETFSSCSNLIHSPVLPSTIVEMNYTYYCCTSLKEVPALPEGLSTISNAFVECDSITEVKSFPSSLTDIGSAFQFCDSLEKVATLPENVCRLEYAFEGCASLKETPYISNTSCDLLYLTGTFSSCTSLTKITNIPVNTYILSGTFSGCESLVEVPTLPENIYDASYAFFGCKKLETAPVAQGSFCTIDSMFEDCTSLKGDIIVNGWAERYEKFIANCAKDADHAITIKGTASTEIKNGLRETAGDSAYVTISE